MTQTGTTPRALIANPGADVYGSDLQMLESLSALVEGGWEVVVVSPTDGPLREKITDLGATFELVPFPVVRRSYMSPKGLVSLTGELAKATPQLIRTLRRVRPDVVYANTTTLPWWIGAARALRIPVVCHVHEAEDKDNRLALKALNAPLLLANHLLLISDTTREAVTSLYPSLAKKSTLLRNGVPDRPVPPVPMPAWDGSTRLGYVARLSPRKGTDVAVRAVAALVADGRDVTLELAGSVFEGYEWYVDELHQIADEAGISDRVTFSGYVSPVYPVNDRAHIVVAPSLREPFGNSVVEAHLAERPVVAARAGGHLESISDGVTGLLVTPGDPDDMARAIASLIDDPDRARAIGIRARESALEKFGTVRYADGVRQVMAAVRRRAK